VTSIVNDLQGTRAVGAHRSRGEHGKSARARPGRTGSPSSSGVPQPDCLRRRAWRVADAGSACWNRSRIRTRGAHADRHRSLPKSDGGLRRRESIINEIRRFELFTDGRSAQVALTKPDLIIERSRLIPALAREATAGRKPDFPSTRVSWESAPMPAGCEWRSKPAATRGIACGQCCRRGRCRQPRGARFGWPPIETVPLVQAIVRLPKDCPPDTTRVWFVRMTRRTFTG